MTLSAFIFYVSNLAIVSGYLFASLLITRRYGVARDMTRRAWIAGLAFFFLCGMTHVELALHAALDAPLIKTLDDWSQAWHLHAIHVPQAVSIWAFLWAMQARPRAAPLEGEASDG